MLERFRKPKWQHPKASVRRDAAEQLTPRTADEAAIIERLARHDEDPGVRKAAIKKLSGLGLLRECMQNDPDNGVAEAATVRYRQILSGGSGEADTRARIEELDRCPSARVLAHVVRGGREEALRLAALERCTDPTVIADAAVNDPVARVRQVAVGMLTDPDALRRVAERTRRGDRKISRLARDKLDAHEQAQAAAAARAQEREAVLAKLESISGGETAAQKAQLLRLENRWQAVAEDAASQESQRYNALMADSRRRAQAAEAQQPEPEKEPEPAVEAAESEPEPLQGSDIATLWANVKAAEEPSAEQIEALHRAFESQSQALDATDRERLSQYLAALQRYVACRAQLEALLDGDSDDDDGASKHARLDSLLETLAWPESVRMPRLLERAWAPHRQRAKQNEAREDEAAKQRAETLQAHLREVDTALGEGNLRDAQRALRKAKSLVEALPKRMAARSQRDLRRYTAKVAELRDWRRFATLPKQEQLCEQMEALIDADMPPSELATAIKSLQDEWKETGGSDSARGRELWERFRAASDQAFEPCRAYFAAEAERRQANLAERERIVEQLEQFWNEADWDNLDTETLKEIRSKAREEWNHYSPVERGPGKPVSRRFESLMDQLTERIKSREDFNRREKAALVERAEALDEIDNIAERVEAAKALQREWREIGPAPPAQNRKLFRAFKAACDKVFAARDEQRKTQRERQGQNKAAAEAVCERLEQLAESGIDDPVTARSELASCEAEFAAIGPLPQPVQEGIQRRFAGAVRQVKQALAAQDSARTDRAYQELYRRAGLCHRLENAVRRGETPPVDQLQGEWDTGELVSEELAAPLIERWERARQAVDQGFEPEAADLAAEQARRLCVRMEILAGMESPELDNDLRMSLQVERLSEGLISGQRENTLDAVRALELEWLANGPVPEEDYPQLEQRFHRARDTALQQARAA